MMEYKDELKNLGVNVEEGIERVMGDEDFYEVVLGVFVDTVYENKILLEDFDKDDVTDLIGQVHMMKGMTGNLAITPLFDGYMGVLGLLRDDKRKEAKEVMAKVLPIQEKVVACIESHRA